jgi:hypothetical protein
MYYRSRVIRYEIICYLAGKTTMPRAIKDFGQHRFFTASLSLHTLWVERARLKLLRSNTSARLYSMMTSRKRATGWGSLPYQRSWDGAGAQQGRQTRSGRGELFHWVSSEGKTEFCLVALWGLVSRWGVETWGGSRSSPMTGRHDDGSARTELQLDELRWLRGLGIHHPIRTAASIDDIVHQFGMEMDRTAKADDGPRIHDSLAVDESGLGL